MPISPVVVLGMAWGGNAGCVRSSSGSILDSQIVYVGFDSTLSMCFFSSSYVIPAHGPADRCGSHSWQNVADRGALAISHVAFREVKFQKENWNERLFHYVPFTRYAIASRDENKRKSPEK